jgi:hypothetical protein
LQTAARDEDQFVHAFAKSLDQFCWLCGEDEDDLGWRGKRKHVLWCSAACQKPREAEMKALHVRLSTLEATEAKEAAK